MPTLLVFVLPVLAIIIVSVLRMDDKMFALVLKKTEFTLNFKKANFESICEELFVIDWFGVIASINTYI